MTKREVDEHLSVVCDGCGLEIAAGLRLTRKALDDPEPDYCAHCLAERDRAD